MLIIWYTTHLEYLQMHQTQGIFAGLYSAFGKHLCCQISDISRRNTVIFKKSGSISSNSAAFSSIQDIARKILQQNVI